MERLTFDAWSDACAEFSNSSAEGWNFPPLNLSFFFLVNKAVDNFVFGVEQYYRWIFKNVRFGGALIHHICITSFREDGEER